MYVYIYIYIYIYISKGPHVLRRRDEAEAEAADVQQPGGAHRRSGRRSY